MDSDNGKPETINTELDKILGQLVLDVIELLGDEFAPKKAEGSPERKKLLSLIPEAMKLQDQALTDSKQELLTYIKEVIGPDDDHTYMQRPDRATDPVRTRNNLRHSILKQVEEELGG